VISTYKKGGWRKLGLETDLNLSSAWQKNGMHPGFSDDKCHFLCPKNFESTTALCFCIYCRDV